MMSIWVEAGLELTFSYKRVDFSDFSVILNISVKTLWRQAIFTLVYQTRWKQNIRQNVNTKAFWDLKKTASL